MTCSPIPNLSIGIAAERGVGYGPYRRVVTVKNWFSNDSPRRCPLLTVLHDHGVMHCGLEVVLPNGELGPTGALSDTVYKV